MEENEENKEEAAVEGQVETSEPADAAPEASVPDAPEMAAAPEPQEATESHVASESNGTAPKRRRLEKVGLVTSDKMQKTVVVRVERQVRHPKYKRYIRRRTKFMAHDELGAHIGDIVRIVETRPLSAHKRWRVVEIVQKAN